MLKRPFKSLIARIAIIALALSLVVPFVPAAFAQDTSIDYAENGTGPVATFAATDQDGDPIEWSLAETTPHAVHHRWWSAGVQEVPQLREARTRSNGGTLADRNVYNVTIEATGGEPRRSVT